MYFITNCNNINYKLLLTVVTFYKYTTMIFNKNASI